MAKTLVEMAAEIVQSQVATRQTTTEEIKIALIETFNALKGIKKVEIGLEAVPAVTEEHQIFDDPKKSIQKQKIICLECGQTFKMLSAKHLKTHGLDASQYRKKYGFSARQPLCAKMLSEKRSQSGKERGIPENLRKSLQQRNANQTSQKKSN